MTPPNITRTPGDGRAYVYDLLRVKSMVTPILAIDASGPDGAPVYACAFNGKRPDMFATGGAKGIQVRIVRAGYRSVFLPPWILIHTWTCRDMRTPPLRSGGSRILSEEYGKGRRAFSGVWQQRMTLRRL